MGKGEVCCGKAGGGEVWEAEQSLQASCHIGVVLKRVLLGEPRGCGAKEMVATGAGTKKEQQPR